MGIFSRKQYFMTQIILYAKFALQILFAIVLSFMLIISIFILGEYF